MSIGSGKPDDSSCWLHRTDARRAEAPEDLPFLAEAGPIEHEDVLHGDHVLLHPGDFGDRGHGGAVGQPGDLNDQSIADAICCRTARSGMFRFAMATIVSSRYSASRGLFA